MLLTPGFSFSLQRFNFNGASMFKLTTLNLLPATKGTAICLVKGLLNLSICIWRIKLSKKCTSSLSRELKSMPHQKKANQIESSVQLTSFVVWTEQILHIYSFREMTANEKLLIEQRFIDVRWWKIQSFNGGRLVVDHQKSGSGGGRQRKKKNIEDVYCQTHTPPLTTCLMVYPLQFILNLWLWIEWLIFFLQEIPLLGKR